MWGFLFLPFSAWHPSNTNKALLEYCLKYDPYLIAVDAPLSLPKIFLEMLETQTPPPEENGEHRKMFYRDCEWDNDKQKQIAMGCLEGRMPKVSIRGLHLKYLLQEQKQKCKLLEVYPKATVQQMGLSDISKNHPQKLLSKMFEKINNTYGVKIYPTNQNGCDINQITPHETDAITSCLTGLIYSLEKSSEQLATHSEPLGWYTPNTNWGYST